MDITAIVLAGGKNRRFGRNKALATIGGISLIEHVVERLRPQTSQILIVTSRDRHDLPVTCNAEIVADIYPDKGPLGGIYTGLLASRATHSLVIACDMPFLNTELLYYMVRQSRDFNVVIPRLAEGKLEPLHAIYSKACLSKIKSQLDWNYLRVDSILDALRVRYVERAECQLFDPQLLSFFNINREADLDCAIAHAVDSSLYAGIKEQHISA
jgi:molybdopterin-guanine dinucleotide biosynthesis protein A